MWPGARVNEDLQRQVEPRRLLSDRQDRADVILAVEGPWMHVVNGITDAGSRKIELRRALVCL